MLRRLARANPTSALVTALVLMLAGLLLPGIVGATVLFLLAAGLATLTFTTWPVQPPPVRVVRVVMLVALFAAAALKVTA
jgi:hypothetical protein